MAQREAALTTASGPTPPAAIRRAAEADFPQLAELLDELAAWHRQQEPEQRHAPGGRSDLSRLETMMNDHDRAAILVAELEPDRRIIGLVSVTILTNNGRSRSPAAASRTAMIVDLVVTRDHRRCGVGRTLIAAAHAWAAAQDVEGIGLSVREANREALLFYGSVGYRPAVHWMTMPLHPEHAPSQHRHEVV